MPTERQQQIEEATRRREALASGRAKSAEEKAAKDATRKQAEANGVFLPFERWRYWRPRRHGLYFAYTPQPVDGYFLSCVLEEEGAVYHGSVVAHKKRRDAKQRAYDISQGYRLAEDMGVDFGTV